MKKQSVQAIAKRFFLGNLLAATLFLSANAASVNPVKFDATKKVEVKYTGVDKYNQLTFNVTYSNPNGSTFDLIVLNEYGETIFKNYYFDMQFDKNFKLPKSEVSKLSFIIQNKKENFKEKFDVNISTQTVENVVINKG